MRCLKRNKRNLYLCSRYRDGKIEKFNSPIQMDINYQATNSEGDLIMLGLDFPMYMRIKADLEYASVFHAKDRIYINNEPNEETFDGLCKDADYEVTSDPIVSLNSVEINLKKLSGK